MNTSLNSHLKEKSILVALDHIVFNNGITISHVRVGKGERLTPGEDASLRRGGVLRETSLVAAPHVVPLDVGSRGRSSGQPRLACQSRGKNST